MTARVITITSGKGGVGKTTATANLGVALATLGHKVACLDADIGLRNLDVVMGLENRIVYDIVDVVEGRARLRQAMIRDKRLKEDLYLIPAAQTRDKTAVSPSDMVRLCDELRPLVDFILIDSPAGIERGFRNAVAPADEVIIITNPEVSSVRDADRIIGLIEAEGKGPGRLIVNRVKPDMVKRGDMLSPEDIIDILAIKLIGLIPEDEAILVSTNRGMPVALSIEETLAGKAFHNIARRILGEDVPFLTIEEEGGFLQRFFRKLKIGGPAQPEASAARSDHRAASAPAPKAERKAETAEAETRTGEPQKKPEVKPSEEEPKKAEEKPSAPVQRPLSARVQEPATATPPAKAPPPLASPAQTVAPAATPPAAPSSRSALPQAAPPSPAQDVRPSPAPQPTSSPAAEPGRGPAPAQTQEPEKKQAAPPAGRQAPAAAPGAGEKPSTATGTPQIEKPASPSTSSATSTPGSETKTVP